MKLPAAGDVATGKDDVAARIFMMASLFRPVDERW